MFCNKEFLDRAWRQYVDLSMQEAITTHEVIKGLTAFIVEAAAQTIERHAHDIVKAGDQFDKGGDIYSSYKPTMQAAEIVRLLKTSVGQAVAPVGITVLASEAIKRGQEAIAYCTGQQGWDAEYARIHAEVVFLPATNKE